MSGMEFKGNSIKEIHQIAVDLLKTVEKFSIKYPEFKCDMMVDHQNLKVLFNLYREND